MKEKRRDSKGRILHTGESQRTDGKYLYKYVDAFGNTKYVYAWRLTPTDPTPKGKREKPSLRELEQQIRRDIEDGIDSTGKKMTLCQLYAKQNAQRANVKKSTQKQREQLMRLLKEDKLGARSIDTIKPSDAKEWALRMKDKGFSYNTINNHKRSLKASFYIAIQDDCVRKNPFDFKLSEVLENDTKEKVALTEGQEQALLSFIKTDNVYHKFVWTSLMRRLRQYTTRTNQRQPGIFSTMVFKVSKVSSIWSTTCLPWLTISVICSVRGCGSA